MTFSTLVTPNDPGLTFDPNNIGKGLKLINMYESCDYAI